MNRLRSVTWHDGNTTQYTYDAGGRLTTITDSLSGTISYEYEGTGCTSGCAGFPDRITSETTSASGGGVVSYTYDALGRRATMTVAGHPPQAEPVNYGYFDNGLLREIRQVVNGVERKFSFEYDNAGRRTGVKYLPGGASVPVMETTYGYDNADRLLNITHRAGAATLENLVYEYDANGARTRFTRNAAQPVRSDSASPTCGTTDYTFDVRGRLTGISGFDGQCNPLTASFRYDALGRRYEKTVNGVTTKYVYDGLDIIQEIQNGTVTANYIRTMNIDEPLMRIKSDGTMRFYKTDALGSVIALTDETGVVRTTYAYDPFGAVTMTGEASDNPFQFAGRENDGTGLLYERNRYYSWEQMRYISEDPIGFAGGDVNLFVRVGNSPVNAVDPLGLFYGALIAKGMELVGIASESTPLAGLIADTFLGAALSMANIEDLPCEEKLGVPYRLVQAWGGISGMRLAAAIATTSPSAGPVLPAGLAFAGGWIIGDTVNRLSKDLTGASISDYMAEGLYFLGQRWNGQ